MNAIPKTTAPAPSPAAAPTSPKAPAPAPAAAMAADQLQLAKPAQAAAQAAAPAETLWQKTVKRGMAGVCGLVGCAAVFVGTIAALEFGIGVPAAHRILGFVAPLTSTIAAAVCGWLGYRQGAKWVG